VNARHSATNAICHTASGQGGTFEIVVIRHPAIVRIAVIDAGVPTVPALAAPGSRQPVRQDRVVRTGMPAT